MQKPSIAELLSASGYTTYTPDLIQRAMSTLYGHVGANVDARDWSAILQSPYALEAAEAALLAMYQSSAYLLANTQHLEQSGYVAAQAEITYRQLAERLGFTHQPSWSQGTAYDYLGPLSMAQLVALVPNTPPPPLPTISVTSGTEGFTVALNVAGTVKLSVSGDLGAFAAGSTLLTEQGSIEQGYLTLAAGGRTSAATSAYVVLGTGGSDTIDTSAAGNRVDYIFGGAGGDTIQGGGGADVLHGGDGDDQFVYLNADELFAGNALVDSIDGGTGTNALVLGDAVEHTGFEMTAAMSWAGMSRVSELRVAGGLLDTRFSIALNDDAYEAGLRTVSLSNHDATATPVNVINVSEETGAGNGYTLEGSKFSDFITGGAGNDLITGGLGADRLVGGPGADTFRVSASRVDSLDVIHDFDSTRDVLDLGIAVFEPAFGAVGNKEDVNLANPEFSTGVTTVSLAADLARTVANTLSSRGPESWMQAGDTIMVRLMGVSVAGNNVLYVLQNQANDSTFDAASEVVVALTGVSMVPDDITDFVHYDGP